MANEKPAGKGDEKPNEKPNDKPNDKPNGGDDAPPASRPLASVAAKIGADIEIEFGDARNRVFMWGPTQEKLRGAWKRANLNGDELVEPLVKLPDLPGQRVLLSAGRKMAVIYDPLKLPEFKTTAERISQIVYDHYRVKAGPAEQTEKRDMDADDVKTWLYLMRRAVDAGSATVTKGSLPTLKEIETLPGRSRVEYFNNSYRACKWREEFGEWLDKILSGTR